MLWWGAQAPHLNSRARLAALCLWLGAWRWLVPLFGAPSQRGTEPSPSHPDLCPQHLLSLLWSPKEALQP